MRFLSVAATAIALTGCSATSSLIDAAPVPATQLTAGASPPPVVVVDTGPPAKDWKNEVTGIDCQRYTWSPQPTNDAAVVALLSKAAERGFNTVHSVKVGADVRSLAMNCWAAVSATGIAFNDPSRPVTAPARPVVKPTGEVYRIRMGQG